MKYYVLLAFAACFILGSCEVADKERLEPDKPIADMTILSAYPETTSQVYYTTNFTSRISYTFDSTYGTDFHLVPQINFIFSDSYSGWLTASIVSYNDSNGIVDITYNVPYMSNPSFYFAGIMHVRFNGKYTDNNGNTHEIAFYYRGENYYLVYNDPDIIN